MAGCIKTVLKILNQSAFLPPNARSRAYHGYYDFAIRMGFIIILLLQLLAQDAMIVYLAIHGQGNIPIAANQRLGTSILGDLALGRNVRSAQRILPTPTMLKRSWART
jgi:hypothetical protein